MPNRLSRLRLDLEFTPSPMEERPGLMIRDPFHYSDVTLVVPPPLVPLLAYFDGEQDEGDLRRALLEMTGDLTSGEVARQMQTALDQAGFLEGEAFEDLKARREHEFAEAGIILAGHAGGAYPDQPEELRQWFDGQQVRTGGNGGVTGIAAPHASPDGGWDCYREAYRALSADDGERTFIVLGTSHYGQPERFGLTRKVFETPFGRTRTDEAMVDWLARRAPRATQMEDYCHAVEHSIEFQAVFLQSLFGADVRVVPVLCGPFARSLYQGGAPEDDDGVKEFIEALGELQAKEGRRLCWVLGVDMAHIGRRYGDRLEVQAHDEHMQQVEQRDRARMAQIEGGDAAAFWDLVQPDHDDLKWCGSSPFYTFLRAVPQARARVRGYQHWDIDDSSVVTFGALEFRIN